MRPTSLPSALRDPAIRARAQAIVSRMSLDEKVGQMTQADRSAISPEEVARFHVGALLSGAGSCPSPNRPGSWVEMNDAYWIASMRGDPSSGGIPAIYGVDAIHGHANVEGATVFPHNIGLGAARDPALVERIARVTARELLATGVDWNFAPTLAVARNPRWGRSYESFSDDPTIVESYAGPIVRGLQSDLGDDAVLACAKHWVGDGGTTNGIDQGDTTGGIDELENVHVRPYRAALAAGAMSVMASFSSWNGDKCHGHHGLLTDLLKGSLGFEGFVVSDWNGIDYLSEDPEAAVGMAVNAGIDLFMVPHDWRGFIAHLLAHVRRGSVSMRRIDDAVRRILSVKIALGLLDKPRPSERRWSNHASFGSSAHRSLAREAVRKSLVLLKNEAGVLPLRRDLRLLVAGKSAHNRGHQCGGFTIDWQGVRDSAAIPDGTSIFEGVRLYSPGAELSIDGSAADAARHDIAIVVIGETPYAEGLGDIRASDHLIVEAGSLIKGSLQVLKPYGRTLELARLHPEDLGVMQRIAGLGIPIVALLVAGRPLVVNAELALASAFVTAWLPGSEGAGIADVFFGEADFSGRLSFAWPSSDTDGPGNSPLFARGFGFGYGNR